MNRTLLTMTLCCVLLWLNAAQAISLKLPIDCRLGADCYIQNYVDLDTGSGWKDYTCGSLSYDGHKGTDFRLIHLQQMRDGVDVLAAANGTVKAIRDGMEDVSIKDEQAVDVSNRECGNGVLLVHEGGYQTQYCHMKRGSISVKQGDTVTAGDKLGKVGLSGNTEFPHLHIVLRDAEQKVIDPFSGAMNDTECDASHTLPFWHESAKQAVRYIPTTILNAGFASGIPQQETVRNGELEAKTLPDDAPILAFWSDSFGLREGDQLYMELRDPHSALLAEHTEQIGGNKAQWFQFIGKRLKQATWPTGRYHGLVRITRQDGTVIDQKRYALEITAP